MRLSNYFLPTMKENPQEAEIVSHRLMVRAGMVRQLSAGIYSWLPLGFKVLSKIEAIVREEQEKAGALAILMPTIQPADLWRESGRYDDYGAEMLRIKDRKDREMLYGPTNEEAVTDIFRSTVRSYKDLPKNLYHIQWKFRDEVRPRFGVMRGREFLMKDNYSFDLDADGAKRSYNAMFIAYLRTFARMGLKAIPMAADTGPIGGDLSHEFIVIAETGESEVQYHKAFDALDPMIDVDYENDLQPIVDKWTENYAVTDEKIGGDSGIAEADLIKGRGIEVGHIFYFGTKYSDAMNANVQGPNDENITVHMGSYGIGVSRLVGAVIEASHDEKGIVWPESVAPYKVGLVNIRADDDACVNAADDMYKKLEAAGVEVLYDDRDERAGVKFSTMELIGLPWFITIGPRGVKNNLVELVNRKTGEKIEVSPDDAISQMIG